MGHCAKMDFKSFEENGNTSAKWVDTSASPVENLTVNEI